MKQIKPPDLEKVSGGETSVRGVDPAALPAPEPLPSDLQLSGTEPVQYAKPIQEAP